MAKNDQYVKATVEDVFAVLTDPETYPQWLVGAKDIRAVDDGWPAVGSRFHHRVGLGPLHIDDTSTVLEIDEPHLLVLGVRATVLLKAVVRFTLTPSAGGTDVEMVEEPAYRLIGNLVRPLLDPATHGRNAVSLETLAELAERRAAPR
ncbi:hypothetical protein BH24ACT3_BH24ACT3_15120 [soil metagenome]